VHGGAVQEGFWRGVHIADLQLSEADQELGVFWATPSALLMMSQSWAAPSNSEPS
jgi:hypothetical protein